MSQTEQKFTKAEILEWIKTSLRELGFDAKIDVDKVTADTHFDGTDDAIGADSLDILTIAMDLEKLTGKKEDFDAESALKVGDLMDFYATAE